MTTYRLTRRMMTDPFPATPTPEKGWIESYGLHITADGKQPLDPRLDLDNHSPTGFECGYGGSGPHQTALAILAHHLGDDNRAQALKHAFVRDVISQLQVPRDQDWEITGEEIDRWMAKEEQHD
ncbi:MAG: DUF6166 domain-containing protein [Salinibacter sp.]